MLENQDLSADLEYYIKHRDELVKKYDGRYILISKQEVLGAFSSQDEAFDFAMEKGLEPGHFAIQLVGPGEDAYTTTLSRVRFYAGRQKTKAWPICFTATGRPR